MKKFYFIFLLALSSSIFFFAWKNEKQNSKSYLENNVNNLTKIIDDSISPPCPNKNNNNLDNSYIAIKDLKIIIPSSRNWSKNLINAYRENNYILSKKYKKRFDAYLFFHNINNITCRLPAKIRLSGDLKDHIKLTANGTIVSSIDIQLLRGNINGITRFKLFLPETRNGSAEVLQASFLREMGYLSPRTKILMVDINGEKLKMILQEKSSKEMLEYNNLRESAIIELDESLIWKLRTKNWGKGSFLQNIFPKVNNRNWMKRNKTNQIIGLEGSNLLSKAILESWNKGGIHNNIAFSDHILSNSNDEAKKILSRFRAHLIASGSKHGLLNHNRKFYYDPIRKSLLPIYYDGDSKINNIENLNIIDFTGSLENKFSTREINNNDLDYAIKEIKAIDKVKLLNNLNLSGIKIKEKKIEEIFKKYIKNLNFLKNLNKYKFETKLTKNPLLRDINHIGKYGIVLKTKNELFYACKLSDNICELINFDYEDINKLLSGNYYLDKLKYYYLGNHFDPINKNYLLQKSKQIKTDYLVDKISITKYGNPKLIIDKNKKLLTVSINDTDQKILISNSNLKDWDIKVMANKEINNESKAISRIDSNLLTSLLTIKDSFFDGSKISVFGGNLEDSLNIINSKGYIDLIIIKDSFQDAIDFDFSNISVGEILVNNSGNDCLDVSSGKYLVKKMVLSQCIDKGVSTGESSILIIEEGTIIDTKIGLVSKDSSELIFKKGLLKDNDLCVAAYNKKQEFGPSKILIPNGLCPENKIAIQNFSTLENK